MMEPTKPFKIYQASAGSGKTYTIVKEYLSLCLKNEAATNNYSHILAITFTNKAANEMKEKIVAQLTKIINSDPEESPKGMEADLIKELDIDRNTLKNNSKLLFQKIIHDYSSFCVSTIDAFFQKVARSFAKDLNLPSQFNVSIDEDEVADAITERIGEQLGSQNPFLTKILEDFCEIKFESESKPRIADNIHAFVKKLFREDTFQKNEQNHFETEEQYKETLDFFHKERSIFEARCNQFIAQFDQFISHNNLSVNDFEGKSRGPCFSLIKKLKEKKFDIPTKTQLGPLEGNYSWFNNNSLDSLTESIEKLYIDFIVYYRSAVPQYLFYKEQIKSLSFYVLRSKIKTEIDEYIGESMVVHITEFNKRINDILGDFSVPFIYERLGEHFKHIFIDEFQDTSILQWQNIIPLIDNNLANQHLNMIVGDGKQSIYRWRNGEVGQIVSLPMIYKKPEGNSTFDTIEQNFINNFNFNELGCNFRSFKNIVEFNNAFFRYSSSNYLPEEIRKVYYDDDGDFQKHINIEQIVMKSHEGLVQVELFDPEEKPEEAMLKRIHELINELLEHGFKKGDIAILVRKNNYGALAANYLHEQGIEVLSPEAILLKSSEKVQLIVNTLDYLIHPDNKAVIANVLFHWNVTHTPNAQGDVSQLFKKIDDIASGKISIEEQMNLKPHLFQTLLSNAFSIYDLCSSLIRVFGFNTIGDAFLNFLLDIVYKWQSTDEYGIERFLNYWDKKKKELSIITNDTDAVNIMTIHKSKGLEFPVVIYPFVDDNINSTSSNPSWVTVEELGFKAIPNISKIQLSFTEKRAEWSPQIAKLRQEELDKGRLDQVNLNYVAFTRPKQRLYILTKQSKKLEISPINAFLQNDSCKLKPIDNTEGQHWPVVYQLGNPNTRKVEEKNDENKTAITEFFNESASGDWFEKINIDPNPSMFWMTDGNSFEPQEWGKLVHKILSEVEHPEDIEKALFPYYDSGVIDDSTVTMLEKAFQTIVSHPKLKEAFSPEAKVKNECELLTGNETKRPDRYAELPEKIYLLDYKTGKPTQEDKEQLADYKEILKTMTDKEICAALVYIKEETVDIIFID